MFAAIALSVIALGVGANNSNSLIVRIDGKETRVTLAGVAAGSERGAAFANCLVAGRVLRIKGPHSAATATLLDDSSVAGHVAEFVQTNTTSDPCAIGKAAYQPKIPTTAPKAAATAQPAKKPVRQVHVSFATGTQPKEGVRVPPPPVTTGEWANTYRPPAPRPKPSDQPVISQPPPAVTYQPPVAGTYTPPTVTATTVTPAPRAQPSLEQQGTQQLPQQGTTVVPTTTYVPPPQ
ncbi:MAG: hypothetical protein AABO58_06795 [Acidobacteriota bacterium]